MLTIIRRSPNNAIFDRNDRLAAARERQLTSVGLIRAARSKLFSNAEARRESASWYSAKPDEDRKSFWADTQRQQAAILPRHPPPATFPPMCFFPSLL